MGKKKKAVVMDKEVLQNGNLRIYHYHPETNVFLWDGEAVPDVNEEDSFLIPSGATTIKPGENIDGKIQKFIDGAWVYEEAV